MTRPGYLLLTILIAFTACLYAGGCGDDGGADTASCDAKACGEVCSAEGDTERYCDPDGICRVIGDEETVECPVCVDAEPGDACQPPCPIGALCGYVGPSSCDADGICVLD